MPRYRRTVPIDDYVLDVLMRDIVGHDQQPAAFLVYLYLSGRAARQHWQPVKSSLRMLADETGLSKSAVQSAMLTLQYRQLVKRSRAHRTAVPAHRVLRHWRSKRTRSLQRSNCNRQFTFPSSLI
jgi:DNA-binding transcriptional MocR family regulator